MAGEDELSEDNPAVQHVVRMADGAILNRFYDKGDYPRAESYREDIETAKEATLPEKEMYRHLRSGAESGWDYSSRWFSDAQNLSTIHTTDIIPVDLNALLYNLETALAEAHQQAGNQEKVDEYNQRAEARATALNAYC